MQEWTDLILAFAILVTSLVNALIGLHGLRKIEAVHVATNSKMDKLLAVTKESAEAKGVLQGRQEIQTERKE